MRIFAVFISFLLVANIAQAKMYTCKFIEGFAVLDYEFLKKPPELQSDITLKEEGPVAIITKANHEGTLVPKIFLKDQGFKTDIYNEGTTLVLLNTETLKLTETFTATQSLGGQQLAYSEYQCEITLQY